MVHVKNQIIDQSRDVNSVILNNSVISPDNHLLETVHNLTDRINAMDTALCRMSTTIEKLITEIEQNKVVDSSPQQHQPPLPHHVHQLVQFPYHFNLQTSPQFNHLHSHHLVINHQHHLLTIKRRNGNGYTYLSLILHRRIDT